MGTWFNVSLTSEQLGISLALEKASTVCYSPSSHVKLGWQDTWDRRGLVENKSKRTCIIR